MIEMALFEPSKETEGKLRWSTYVESDNTYFHLYIPKWRVPEPWPGRIFVSIDSFDEDPATAIEKGRTMSDAEPIEEILEMKAEHTKTIRFSPVGDPKSWHTGEPYIPFSLVPPESHYLRLRVKWDLDSQGEFTDVPTYRDE